MKENTMTFTGVAGKTALFAAAVACAFTCAAVGAGQACAADTQVALTIVDSTATSGGVICNEAVEVSDTATVADVLKAAGYKEVATVAETSASKTYAAVYDYPYFAGKEMVQDENYNYTYWMDFIDGVPDGNNGAALACSLSSTVMAGAHYQFVYDTAVYDENWNMKNTFEYTANIPDPLASSDGDGQQAKYDKVTVNAKTITASKIDKATRANTGVVVLGAKVKIIKSGAFKRCGVTKLIVKTKKLTKKNVKNCLKGSIVKTVKVPAKKYKAYKKIFVKSVCGKNVKVTK